jgi:PAS domain S-box-containing protein
MVGALVAGVVAAVAVLAAVRWRRHEAGLRDAVRRLTQVADRISDMISVHDPHGVYAYVSAASVPLLGYEPDELVGQSPYNYVHPDDVPDVREAHVAALSSGAGQTVVYRMRRSDGTYAWFETITRTISDPSTGEMVEVLCSSRDVTAREASQAARRSAFEAARARIQGVIERDALTIAYQPICRLDTREPVAYEALARFTPEPRRTPDVWFAEARAVGLGEELELLAVRKALEAVPDLPDALLLSINVSPETLCRQELRRILRRVPLQRLVFEITEHAPIDDYQELLAVMERFSARGIGIAVDDAGAGYSSLRHILNLHPQTIKLDVSLTHELHRDTSRRALTAALSSFADELDATVVAEGIETEAELEALLLIGVGFGQGYLLGRPGPIDDRVPVQA